MWKEPSYRDRRMPRPALSAARAVAVLDFLAAHPRDSFTLSDISARLDINLASAHSLLAVLADAGYVVRSGRQRTFGLGPAVVALGMAALERHTAIDLARDAARQLAADLALEVAVSAPAGEDIVFLARAGELQPRGIPVHVGQRVPLAPPLGSVFVAWTDAAEWLARSQRPEQLAEVLVAVRGRGYSVALELETRRALGSALEELADAPAGGDLHDAVAGIVSDLDHSDYQLRTIDPAASYDVSMIAAPVFGPASEVVLAISLVGFPTRLLGATLTEHGERLRDAALVVTRQSGGRIPTA